jgi:predicted DNA-binding transcriptional regulator YafY
MLQSCRMKLDRLLSIVILLLNRELVSAQELAERYGVTVRTIYRDLEAIDLAGIPVVSQAGPGGGFGIDPGYTIDRRLLGLRDLSSILAALKGVNEALGDDALGSALEKLKSMAPRTGAGTAYEERLVIDLFPWGKRDEERSMASVIDDAILESRLLRFSYASIGKERDDRIVEPMTLVFKAYSWYLWGYCRKRCDFRLFKLARMKELRSSMERFQRRSGAYRGDPLPALAETEEIKLRFALDRLESVQEWFPSDGIQLEKGGGIAVTMKVPPGDWIVNTLLGMGTEVEVLEPRPLREKLAEAGLLIAKKNGIGKNS